MREIALEEQFLPLSTIFCYLRLDFYAKTGIRFSLRDKRLFEITEVEITRVDCSFILILCKNTAIFAEKDSEACKSSSHFLWGKKSFDWTLDLCVHEDQTDVFC